MISATDPHLVKQRYPSHVSVSYDVACQFHHRCSSHIFIPQQAQNTQATRSIPKVKHSVGEQSDAGGPQEGDDDGESEPSNDCEKAKKEGR
jgi:hypothetical protein